VPGTGHHFLFQRWSFREVGLRAAARATRHPRRRQSPLFSSPAKTRSSLVLSRASRGLTKRLEILRELVPTATRVGVLVNPANPTTSEVTVRLVEAGGRAMGLQALVLNASTSREIHAAFATLARERPTEAHGRRLAQMRSLIAASPLAAQILAGGASRNTRREPKSR
jgi:hypothetical protein